MKNTISFDFWGTLFKSASNSWEVKTGLINDYLNSLFTIEQVKAAFKPVDESMDYITEHFAVQPCLETAWSMIFQNLGHKKILLDIPDFAFWYSLQMANNGLDFRDDTVRDTLVELLDRSFDMKIVSNTLFIKGKHLERFLREIDMLKFFNDNVWSDEKKYGKPHPGMWTNDVRLHVGDNHVTDGACLQKNISFFFLTKDKKVCELLNSL